MYCVFFIFDCSLVVLGLCLHVYTYACVYNLSTFFRRNIWFFLGCSDMGRRGTITPLSLWGMESSSAPKPMALEICRRPDLSEWGQCAGSGVLCPFPAFPQSIAPSEGDCISSQGCGSQATAARLALDVISRVFFAIWIVTKRLLIVSSPCCRNLTKEQEWQAEIL